jgi:hypothetical protein
MLAVEIVRAAWRLHRCAIAEAEDGRSTDTQAAADRARASAHGSSRRLLNDLRALQSDRWLRAEVLRPDFDQKYFGVADTHTVIKGLAGNERLKALYLMSPIGIDPLNQTVGKSAPVAPAVYAAGARQAAHPAVPAPANTIRTQSPPAPSCDHEMGQAVSPGNHPVSQPSGASVPTPRNAPCPCNSGLKYKRCCGTAAPPVLTTAHSAA